MIPFVVEFLAAWLGISDPSAIKEAEAIVLAGVALGALYLALAIFLGLLARFLKSDD